jgi:lysozyme
MKIGDAGIALIKEFEGFRKAPYLCSAGVPTIGFGSTLYTDGRKVRLCDVSISEATALELFHDTLHKYEQTVDKVINVPLTQNQFDACVCLCYNIGQGNFASSTLVKMLNARTSPVIIAPQFLRWNKAAGEPSKGLTRRREAEMNLFLKA